MKNTLEYNNETNKNKLSVTQAIENLSLGLGVVIKKPTKVLKPSERTKNGYLKSWLPSGRSLTGEVIDIIYESKRNNPYLATTIIDDLVNDILDALERKISSRATKPRAVESSINDYIEITKKCQLETLNQEKIKNFYQKLESDNINGYAKRKRVYLRSIMINVDHKTKSSNNDLTQLNKLTANLSQIEIPADAGDVTISKTI